ncbi:hypothetical protein DS2_17812 [Catenovulum agarivorans DS-2]|uniref:Uncharacterized protein n=2 Tax=Catenovulum agarivorans TaxID=1172192 RepID=W7QHE4_9ALTE|nr:hypothetical protein DS2_17812 [Catenovulum agarivorans DS-2]
MEYARADDSRLLDEFRGEYAIGLDYANFSVSVCAEVFVDRVFKQNYPDWCELFVRFNNEQLSITLGRQTLNWSLGRYFYVNDPFAKDWQSPAIGRDKGDIDDVNDGAQLTLFNLFATQLQFDWVWAKFVATNTYADFARVSLEQKHQLALEAEAIDDSEHMFRLSQQTDALNWAVFYRTGYQRQAQLTRGQYQYNSLEHLGFSISKQLGLGKFAFEYGHSRIDHIGDESRFLFVFEPKFTQADSGQFLRLQWMKDPQSNWLGIEYQNNLNESQALAVTQLFSTEFRSLMLMAHYNVSLSQHWLWEIGVNVFAGQDTGAQWDYFAQSSNVYSRIRYQL